VAPEETGLLDDLRRRAAQNAESEDYEDDEETLADRAAFTRLAYDLQVVVIQSAADDNEL
jgi:hypothetical protein